MKSDFRPDLPATPEVNLALHPSGGLHSTHGSEWRAWMLPFILFWATFATTTLVGLLYSWEETDSLWALGQEPWIIVRGLGFSVTLMTILLAHEMGHFLACRYYGIRCTPPYFIPLPFPPAGTLGAFIRIKAPFQDKRALFDVGVAGPLAGFLFVVPALVIGIALSRLIPKGLPPGYLQFGEPLLFQWVAALILDYTPASQDIIAHPIAMAAWFGLLVTCLNLLPIWQLDGGHIAYALLGAGLQRKISIIGAWALLAVSFPHWPPPYLVFGLILLISGWRFRFYHPPTLADEDRIGAARIGVSVVALVILIISFTRVPIYIN